MFDLPQMCCCVFILDDRIDNGQGVKTLRV